MEAITDRLTNDRIAERMISQIAQGYTAPALVREWLIYIKLNQLENRLEPKQPFEKDKSNYYNICPGCGRRISKSYALPQFRPDFCENCG